MRNHELDQLHLDETRALAELRKAEKRMAAHERELERKLDELDAVIDGAEDVIDRYLRSINGGRDPDHPAYWHAHAPDAKRRAKGRRPASG